MLAVVLLSVAVGIALGLFGGGGSILTVPILVYVAGLPAHEAIATSLLVVGVTSVAAMIPHARAGHVRVRTGLVFGGAAMIGAFAAGRLAHLLSGQVLLVAFAVMMVVPAVAMLRKRTCDTESGEATEESERPARDLPLAKVIAEGILVGAVTGLVGAGGGFLVVPALVLLGGMSMRTAIGTSLLVVAMKSFAGFAGYLGHVEIGWTLAGAVTAAAVIGSVAGAMLAGRIPQAGLRRAFAGFILAMGAFVLVQQLA